MASIYRQIQDAATALHDKFQELGARAGLDPQRNIGSFLHAAGRISEVDQHTLTAFYRDNIFVETDEGNPLVYHPAGTDVLCYNVQTKEFTGETDVMNLYRKVRTLMPVYECYKQINAYVPQVLPKAKFEGPGPDGVVFSDGDREEFRMPDLCVGYNCEYMVVIDQYVEEKRQKRNAFGEGYREAFMEREEFGDILPVAIADVILHNKGGLTYARVSRELRGKLRMSDLPNSIKTKYYGVFQDIPDTYIKNLVKQLSEGPGNILKSIQVEGGDYGSFTITNKTLLTDFFANMSAEYCAKEKKSWTEWQWAKYLIQGSKNRTKEAQKVFEEHPAVRCLVEAYKQGNLPEDKKQGMLIALS